MKMQTIKDNCERLISFKKINIPKKDFIKGDPSAALLLRWYGRLLDYCGAPREGLSILYVSELEFDELIEFAGSVDKNTLVKPMGYAVEKDDTLVYVGFPKYIRFNYLGYNWHIEKDQQ